MKKYRCKCRKCGRQIQIEYSYDYDTGCSYKGKDKEICNRCLKKTNKEWEKQELHLAGKYFVPIKGIRQLSSKKVFIKNYDTLNRSGVEVSPEDKGEKCRWCGGSRIFRYILNDWEYQYELICIDCMGKILESVELVLG